MSENGFREPDVFRAYAEHENIRKPEVFLNGIMKLQFSVETHY